MITGDPLELDGCFPTRANLLVTGPDDVTDSVVQALRSHLQDPVMVLRRGEPLALPSAPVGTLLVADVGALTPEEQCRLFDWLEQHSTGTQVISMATTSLMPMVAAGSFLEGLYYRLNTIYIDVTAVPSLRSTAAQRSA
jgi:transcriptional regulator of aromatic amino acid metabolism